MNAKLKHFFILGLGWVFVFLGVLGLFLPFLQGLLFLFIGFYLLSRESPRIERFLNNLRERYPIIRKIDGVRERGEEWVKRIFRKK